MLKTFQMTLVFQKHILKADCVNKERSWTIIFYVCIAKKQIFFMKINEMRANLKLLDFHYILNSTRIVFPHSV